ncbi:MAG: AlpA family transcriptional regulator [Burkholderiaceae bacterium]
MQGNTRAHVGAVLIRKPEVLARCGFSNSELYRLIAAGKFPVAVPLGVRAVAWPLAEIDAWISSRIAARGQA